MKRLLFWMRVSRQGFVNTVIDVLGPLLAVAFATVGLKGFLVPSGFFDGGVTGIGLLLREVLDIPLAVSLPLVNLPFVLLGLRENGHSYAIRSMLLIATLALALGFVDVPVITYDKTLAAVFGGFFVGTGIGLAVRRDTVLDGTEILALQLSKRSFLRVGDVILLLNIVIFGVIGLLLGVERALYSILTYLVAGRAADFLIHGVEEYTAVTIVSQQPDRIRHVIQQEMNRGVTIYQGRAGMSDQPLDILYCVITRLEIPRMRRIVEAEDPNAFVTMHTIDDTTGGMTERRGILRR